MATLQNRLSPLQQRQICEGYLSGESAAALGRDFGICLQSVCNLLERHGVSRRGVAVTTALTDEQKDSVCVRYRAGEKVPKIAASLNVRLGSIHSLLTERGFAPSRQVSPSRRKYACNHQFFNEIRQESQAYVLGLMAADGNVHRDYIKLALHRKDAQLLRDVAGVIRGKGNYLG